VTAPLHRSAFAWTSSAVVASLLPVAPSLPGWLSAMLLLLAVLGATLGLRGVSLPGLLRLALTVTIAGGVLYAFDFRFGRDTGAALLAVMLALKLLETRRTRDARSVLGFSLFAIMAGFLQSQAPQILLLALLATVLILTASARVTDFDLPGGTPPPSTGYRDLLSATGLLLLLSLPLAIAGFFLFPRLATPLWGLPDNAAEARTGLSDEMTPGDIANLFIDESPVLRVQFFGTPPPQYEMYWRGPVLGFFDGRTWSRSYWSSFRDGSELEALSTPLEYEVTQEPTDRRFRMVLDMPVAAPDGSSLGSDRAVTTRRPQIDLVRYRARSVLRYRLEPNMGPAQQRALTDLPRGFNPRTQRLMDDWRAEGASPTQLVRRALNLFNAEFSYTLRPSLLGRDSVDDFLFNTRAGYCEHFSSAFVVMMRAGGIPARVVTGYQGGRGNELGDYWVVRQADAHAWAEVWLEGSGWVRIDPTSAVAPERIERGSESLDGPESFWTRYSRPMFDAGDWLRRGWNDIVLGFNAARQRNLLQPFGIAEASRAQLGAALLLSSGLALLVTVGLLLRRPRAQRDALAQAYAAFLRRLSRTGVTKLSHETALAFACRAATLLPTEGEEVVALSQRYTRLRYARSDDPEQAAQRLCSDLRRFRIASRSPGVARRSA
jgi:transglutaminase-like putative cysteine protease